MSVTSKYKSIKVLILAGDGINCEQDCKLVFDKLGAQSHLLHINELQSSKLSLQDYQILVLPGGFSFGDALGSGKILGHKLKLYLRERLFEFVEMGFPVIGICNGFQALVNMGLLPFGSSVDESDLHQCTLTFNEPHGFINKWVTLKTNKGSKCLWTQSLPESFMLPIRHGEGRLAFSSEGEKNVFPLVNKMGLGALHYGEDFNGSIDQIAALTNPEGNILGLMPHPEAFIHERQHPYYSMYLKSALEKTYLREQVRPVGLDLFVNALNYLT